MDARTRTALEGSIAKWQAIVDGTGIDDGYKNCPLCNEFINEPDPENEMRECYGCPVSEKTGTEGCADTPYEEWNDYLRGRDAIVVFDIKSAELAANELNFLIGLLPHTAAEKRPTEEGK